MRSLRTHDAVFARFPLRRGLVSIAPRHVPVMRASSSSSRQATIAWIDWAVCAFLVGNLCFVRYLRAWYPPANIIRLTVVDGLIAVIAIGYLLRQRHRIGGALLVAVGVSVIIALNFANGGLNAVAVKNVVTLLSPATVLVYMIYLTRRYEKSALLQLVSRLAQFLNAYFLVNSIIIYVQIETQTFMMASFLRVNSFAGDHMDGLIGLNGVSVLNFVWVATLLLNFAVFIERRSRRYAVLVVIEFLIMAHISSQNDNKMFLPTMAVFLAALLYFLLRSRRVSSGTMVRIVVGAALALGVVATTFGVFSSADSARKPTSIPSIVFYQSLHPPDPNNERAYINYLAYTQYDAWEQGLGLGRVDLDDQNIHLHLAINSAILILIFGGIVLLLGIMTLYSSLALKIFNETSPATWLVFAGVLGTAAYASVIFQDHYTVIAVSIALLALYVVRWPDIGAAAGTSDSAGGEEGAAVPHGQCLRGGRLSEPVGASSWRKQGGT